MKSELKQLLSDNDQNIVEDFITKYGYYNINDIKNNILKNSNITNFNHIDVDTIITIDLYINYPIYITNSDIFTREIIIEKFDMNIFGVVPENIFNRLYIIVVQDEYFLYDPEVDKKGQNDIYPTQIYLGKEKWEDYMLVYRMHRTLKTMPNAKIKLIDNNENNIKK